MAVALIIGFVISLAAIAVFFAMYVELRRIRQAVESAEGTNEELAQYAEAQLLMAGMSRQT